MSEEQFERLMGALFDIKAEIRDLRNDVRKRDERRYARPVRGLGSVRD